MTPFEAACIASVLKEPPPAPPRKPHWVIRDMEPHPNIDRSIETLIQSSGANEEGFSVKEALAKCSPLVVVVNTKNTRYTLTFTAAETTIVSDKNLNFMKPTRIRFQGSTFGGSMIKLDWIGVGMYLEFIDPSNRVWTTTAVTSWTQQTTDAGRSTPPLK